MFAKTKFFFSERNTLFLENSVLILSCILPCTRYRTLTIYNVLFEQNKMADGGIRNSTTGVSVGVSCFYSHNGPS